MREEGRKGMGRRKGDMDVADDVKGGCRLCGTSVDRLGDGGVEVEWRVEVLLWDGG